jgi:hypothetical protein
MHPYGSPAVWRSTRARRAVGAIALLLLAACAEEPATGPSVGAAETASDLEVVAPTGLRDRMVTRTSFVDTARTGPARTEDLGYGTYYGYDTETVDTEASIWDHKTRANFLSGQLSVVGSHYYIANKSSVDTQARLSLNGSQLASQRSYSENSHPFVVPILTEQFIWTEARIYTDRECGLSGAGDSAHAAWWEAVLGGPVFSFSRVSRTSNSDLASQPLCPTSSSTTTTVNGGESGSTGGGSVVCYVWVQYDLFTGDIYDQQLLYCEDGG